jgi:L-aminopeptidase/D-esterase-like protein
MRAGRRGWGRGGCAHGRQRGGRRTGSRHRPSPRGRARFREGRELVDTAAALEAGAVLPHFRPVNTTIGVIATTAGLGKSEAARLAHLSLEGFEHALSPPHLPTDGDALFCLSIGEKRAELEALGAAAAQAVAAAIARAVLYATPLPGLPAAGD